MGNQVTTSRLTAELASRHRVLMLGGLAVITHGHSRPTYDADIWLDAALSVSDWCGAVESLLAEHPELRFLAIGSWREVADEDFRETVEQDGVFRLTGANQPLDIFRAPNELPMAEFDAVWDRATPMDDGTRLPDAIDILLTKQETGRDKDVQDILFLEAKAERDYLARLPAASGEEAVAMLERFLTPKVAECALDHPDARVQSLATRFLRELADEGNPFARDIAIARGLAAR